MHTLVGVGNAVRYKTMLKLVDWVVAYISGIGLCCQIQNKTLHTLVELGSVAIYN